MSSKDWIQIQMSRHARQSPPKLAVSICTAGHILSCAEVPGNPLGKDLPVQKCQVGNIG